MGDLTAVLETRASYVPAYVHSTMCSPRVHNSITLDSDCATSLAETRNVLCTYVPARVNSEVFNPIYLPWVDFDGLNHDIIIHKDYQEPVKDIERTIDILGVDSNQKHVARLSLESIRDLIQWDESFKAEGRLERLSGWLSSNGRSNPAEPMGYGATTNKGTLMWTRPNFKNEVLGVNTYYNDIFNAEQANSGMTRDEMIEYGLTHEYVHLSQPDSMFKRDKAIVEADVFLTLSHYFHGLAKTDSKYTKMASYSYARYVTEIKRYALTNNIQVTEEELKEIIESNDLEGVIEKLDSKPKASKQTLEERVGKSALEAEDSEEECVEETTEGYSGETCEESSE